MRKKRIYLDYATTTPLDPLVERAMKPYFRNTFGNSESLHAEGVAASQALAGFRTSVARLMQAHGNEIFFTSGGTEANNLALRGYVSAIERQGVPLHNMHIIVSTIEHSSVRECAHELKRLGVQVSWLPVNEEGLVSINTLEKLITKNTILVSVMHANNEIGTVEPIEKISTLLKRLNHDRKIPIRLHADACQSALFLSVDQSRLGADFLSLDGHKLYGPKGVGVLYVRNGTPITPILFGGEQERGKRPGTVALALVAGFSSAFALAVKNRKSESARLISLRDYFVKEILHVIPRAELNGSASMRLPNNVNISIPGLLAEFAVLQLDALGIACSAKSACLEHERESYVIKALGRNDGAESSSLRFTLGSSTKKGDIKIAIRMLETVVGRQKIPKKSS